MLKSKITALFALPILFSSLCFAIPTNNVVASEENDCVILLHGLARTSKSMTTMKEALSREGYKVVNIDYPSRKFRIEKLANDTIPKGVMESRSIDPNNIHFVTHSLGGILIRYYLSAKRIQNLGRVVMLSPPNQGSEIVDKLGNVPGFYWLNGPAGQQLGTIADSIPIKLGEVKFELGVITGNKSINLILSLLIPGDDDGKVSIENAKVKGMSDFLVLPHSHPFIMKSDDVIHQTKHFLQYGRFEKPTRSE
ncbi:MAG: alpha/beta hydrolase [Proteobacteria bacterium]|nr:alpha/beta hydrolase [Pseudomonadota bacterium]